MEKKQKQQGTDNGGRADINKYFRKLIVFHQLFWALVSV